MMTKTLFLIILQERKMKRRQDENGEVLYDERDCLFDSPSELLSHKLICSPILIRQAAFFEFRVLFFCDFGFCGIFP